MRVKEPLIGRQKRQGVDHGGRGEKPKGRGYRAGTSRAKGFPFLRVGGGTHNIPKNLTGTRE